MEDIGDLLFYLLAGLFAVAGLIGKKKKNPVLKVPGDDFNNNPDESPGEPVFDKQRRYEEILNGEIFGIPVPEIVEEEEESEVFLESSRMEGVYEEEMAKLFSGEGISSIVSDNMEVSEIDEEGEIGGDNFIEMEDDESVVKRIADTFNLPEAIIYSEILNRKERF